jgi:hypothetical protein
MRLTVTAGLILQRTHYCLRSGEKEDKVIGFPQKAIGEIIRKTQIRSLDIAPLETATPPGWLLVSALGKERRQSLTDRSAASMFSDPTFEIRDGVFSIP